MENKIVKHHNDLNMIVMRRWTAEEMNFFFAIIFKARNQGTKDLIFEKNQLAELANYSIVHNQRFYKTIDNLVDNISKLRYFKRTSRSIEYMALFTRFRVEWAEDLSEMKAIVNVSDEFEYIVNKLEANFTQYELEEFTKIRSTYAKTAYRLLKQWRFVGKKEFSIDEFKTLMDTPKYYQVCDLDRLVFKPILKELSRFFINLKVKKIKSNKRGNPVLGYEFTWQPDSPSEWIDGKFQTKVLKPEQKNQNKLPAWYQKTSQTPITDETRKELEKRKQRLKKFDKVELEDGDFVDQGILFDD